MRISRLPYFAISTFAVAATLVSSQLASGAQRSSKELRLGVGTVSIRIPSDSVVDLEPGFEVAWYRVVDADRLVDRQLRIGVTETDVGVNIAGVSSRACINGLHGKAFAKEGYQTVVLDLPPSSRMFKVIFWFKDSNLIARDIVRSITVRGYKGHCQGLRPGSGSVRQKNNAGP